MFDFSFPLLFFNCLMARIKSIIFLNQDLSGQFILIFTSRFQIVLFAVPLYMIFLLHIYHLYVQVNPF